MATPRRRLLLIDDCVHWRRTVERMLRSKFELVEAASYEEAVPLLEAQSHALDLVLLDLNLGDGHLRGQDALPLLAAQWPSLPVVVMTVENDATQAVRLLRLGALDYVTKDGCVPEALIAKLEQLLADVALSREIQLLRILLASRLEAQRARWLHIAANDGLPLLPAQLVRPLDEVKRDYCAVVLRACGGNLREAARRLEVPYSSLRADLIRWRVVGTDSTDAPRKP